MAFLLATIAAYGDRWPDYWADLMANGTKLTDGWSDAYYVDFTQGGGQGTRPIVLSYDSSPAFTLDGGTSTTEALLDTCFQQVEYAGVLAGAANPEGARAFTLWTGKPAPLDVMRTAVALLPDLLFVAEQGNPNAASDAAVGALMVKTCVHGSAYNTLINVKSLGEHPMAAPLKADCQTIRAACDSFAAMVLATVEAKL